MPKVLIVDDSEMDRRMAGRLLEEDKDLTISYAADGKQALELVEESEPDLVVTDLQMPRMDGLALVTNLRMNHPRIPVVLMTAHGSETIAAQALEQGASNYVPKSQLGEKLLDTVRDIFALAKAERTYERLIDCSTRTQFDFNLENDPGLISPLVALVQQMVASMQLADVTGQLQIGVAFEQALNNAILHGNLELTTAELKQTPMEREMLVARRQLQHPYSRRRVFVNIVITRDEISVLIRDEGHGFDVARIFPAEGVDQQAHRGLVLMKTFTDEVQFNEKGNEVTLVRRKRD